MKHGELIRRYALMAVGVMFMALGVATTKRAELGISPISSIPNVMSYRFTLFTMGTWLTVWNLLLIAAQAVMLKREFRLTELMQVPVSLLFGWFTDIGARWVAAIPTQAYAVRALLVIAGTALLGFGIALTLLAGVAMNPGEALVKTVARKTKKDFGTLKITLDVSYVAVSVLLSLILFGGKVVGTREGTVFAAVFTGISVKLFVKLMKAPVGKLFMD